MTASITFVLMVRLTHPCARRGSHQVQGRAEITATSKPECLPLDKPESRRPTRGLP